MTAAPHPTGGNLATITDYTVSPLPGGGMALRLHEGHSAPLKWVAGGGTFVLEDRYAILLRRDDRAPTNPGKLTVATGLADGAHEWERPSGLLRELFEELILLRDGEQLVPMGEFAAHAEAAIRAGEALGVSAATRPVTMRHRRGGYPDEVTTGAEVVRGVLSIDPESGGANLMWALEFDGPLAGLRLHDGELDPAGRPLRREIFFYDLTTARVLDADLRAVSSPPPLTHHARTLLTALALSPETPHGQDHR